MKKLIFIFSAIAFFSCEKIIYVPTYKVTNIDESKRMALAKRLGLSLTTSSGKELVVVAGTGQSNMCYYHIADLDSVKTNGVQMFNLLGIKADLSNFYNPTRPAVIDTFFQDQTCGKLVGVLPLLMNSLQSTYGDRYEFGVFQYAKGGTSQYVNWNPNTKDKLSVNLFSQTILLFDQFLINLKVVPHYIIWLDYQGEQDVSASTYANAYYILKKKMFDSLKTRYGVTKFFNFQLNPYYQHNVRYDSVANGIFRLGYPVSGLPVKTISYMDKNYNAIGPVDVHTLYIPGLNSVHKSVLGLKYDRDSLIADIVKFLP